MSYLGDTHIARSDDSQKRFWQAFALTGRLFFTALFILSALLSTALFSVAAAQDPDLFVEPVAPDLSVNPAAGSTLNPSAPDVIANPTAPDLFVEPAVPDLVVEPVSQAQNSGAEAPDISTAPSSGAAGSGGASGSGGTPPSSGGSGSTGSPPPSSGGGSGGSSSSSGGSSSSSGSGATGSPSKVLASSSLGTGPTGGGGGSGVPASPSQSQIASFSIEKLVRNKTKGETAWLKTTRASPSDVVEFRVMVQVTGSLSPSDFVVREFLPRNLPYHGNLKVNNVQNQQNISLGVKLPAMSAGGTYDIEFEAQVAPAANLAFGKSDLINVILVYNTQKALTDTATLQVERPVLPRQPVAPPQPLPLGLEVSAAYTPRGILILAKVHEGLSGPITYKVDCNVAEGQGWDSVFTGNSTEFSALCTYPELTTYTAKVRAERLGVAEEKTIDVNVLALTPPSSAGTTGFGFQSLLAGLGTLDLFGNPLFIILLLFIIVFAALAFLLRYVRRIEKHFVSNKTQSPSFIIS